MPRPSRPWFRFYVEAVHDRKLRRLKPEYRWLFVACLAAARQSPEPGVLLVGADDPMTVDDLVDFAGMPARAVELGMRALCAAGVLGFDEPRAVWFVPAWNDRQYESDDVTARTRRHRERSNERGRNVPTAFPGTPPDTEADTDPPGGAEAPPNPDQASRLIPELVATYVDEYRLAHGGENPIKPWRDQAGKQAKNLVTAGVPLADVRGVLIAAGRESKSPAILPHLLADLHRERAREAS